MSLSRVQRISISHPAISPRAVPQRLCNSFLQAPGRRVSTTSRATFPPLRATFFRRVALGSKHLSFTMEEVVHEFTLVDLAQDGAHEASRYIILYIYIYVTYMYVCVYTYIIDYIYYHILSYIIIYYHILSYIIIYYLILSYIIIYYRLLSYIII